MVVVEQPAFGIVVEHVIDETLNGRNGSLELRHDDEPLAVENPKVKCAAVMIIEDG